MPTQVKPTHITVIGRTTAKPVAPPPATLSTPQGSINWSQSSDGSIQAEGGGQKVVVTRHDQSNGSWQSHADYSLTGSAPYLSMDLLCDIPDRKVQFTLTAGSSHLTLTVTGIDALVKSGTATLSGTWNGAAVNWTGHADLTSNPFVTRPVAGWPAGAFASQLQKAAFFAPLGNALSRNIVAHPATTTGSATDKLRTVGGVLGRAGAWCAGGAVAGLGGAPETLGASSLLGCAGGATASLLSDFVSWLDSDDEPSTPPNTPGDGSQSSSPSNSGDGGHFFPVQTIYDTVSNFSNSNGGGGSSNQDPSHSDDGPTTTYSEQ
jgi:hypothetical protein